jgi:hypothetical protein
MGAIEVPAPVFAVRKNLEDIFDETTMKYIMKEVMKSRRVSPTDEVSYSPVERQQDGVTYVVKAEHVPIEDIVKHASSRCRDCNSKGYSVRHIEKAKIPNPQDYVILSDKPIDSMTDEEKKLWVEVEKKKKMWRIMLPCHCAIKGLTRVQHTIFTNATGNIVAQITYEKKQ